MGSHVAARLARLGYEVAVLEKKETVGGKSCCTGIIGLECVRAFDIDRGVIMREASGARLFSPSGRSLKIRREEPQAAILDRTAFDVMMAERARQAGARYILASAVTGIEVADGKVRVEVSNGATPGCEARAAVIASGFSSGLTEKLGMGTAGDFVAGAQVEIRTTVEEVEVYLGERVAPGFFGWLVPTLPGMARVGLLSRRRPGHYLNALLDYLSAEGKATSVETDPAYGAVPLRPLRRTSGERLLVVGDAAGQVKPTTGGGIYYGLMGADITAGVLHQALCHNDFSAPRFARYEREWKGRLQRELNTGYWVRRAFERLSDGQIDGLFDIMAKKHVAEKMLERNGVSFDWHSRAIMPLITGAGIGGLIGMLRLMHRGKKDV